jgi:hypothetical protein
MPSAGSSRACIYCGATGVPFNRDHVIPEAFGTFHNNLVVTCVCAKCNQFFGDELELVLGRNSREAILRLHHGLKAPTGAHHLKYDNVKLTVGEAGPWRGAQIILAADLTGTKLDTKPIAQVAFRKKGEQEWRWFPEVALTDASVVAPYRTSDSVIQIVGPSQADIDRLTTKLNAFGISFNQKGVLPQPVNSDGTILTRLASRVDEAILRAVAKIAGNYIAYVHGAEFFLAKDFDAFRNWVRFGTTPTRGTPVVVVTTPILADDSEHWRQTTGHIVTFDWNRQGDGLFAQVSLFNDLNYKALSCPKYSGLWRDLRSGHHFDLNSRVISELRAATFL